MRLQKTLRLSLASCLIKYSSSCEQYYYFLCDDAYNFNGERVEQQISDVFTLFWTTQYNTLYNITNQPLLSFGCPFPVSFDYLEVCFHRSHRLRTAIRNATTTTKGRKNKEQNTRNMMKLEAYTTAICGMPL
jgi:hypothetical protein